VTGHGGADPTAPKDALASTPAQSWQPRCLKPETWPLIDRLLWEAACLPAGLLDDSGAAARLAEGSRQKYRKGYGVWLSFLIANGWLDPEEHPAKRITRRRLAAYFEAMRHLKQRGYTIFGRFLELRGMMKTIAPDHDTAWILRPNGLTIRQILRPANRTIVVPDSGVLYQWAIGMMESTDLGTPRKQGLLAFRDGLLLAMLAARGRRLRALSLLRDGHEIQRVGGNYRIELQAHQVKTKKFDAFSLPTRLTPFVNEYAHVVRPVLLGGQVNDAFWVGHDGTPLTAKGIQAMVFRRTKVRFEVAFGPHRFRHAIATTAALRASDIPGLAAPLLGISPGVEEAHYNRASQVAAVRKFQSILDSFGTA